MTLKFQFSISWLLLFGIALALLTLPNRTARATVTVVLTQAVEIEEPPTQADSQADEVDSAEVPAADAEPEVRPSEEPAETDSEVDPAVPADEDAPSVERSDDGSSDDPNDQPNDDEQDGSDDGGSKKLDEDSSDDAEVGASVEPDTNLPSANVSFLFDGGSPETLEQLQAMEAHFAELAEEVAAATVNIQVGMGQGSGVVVTRDGYILTAAHVIGRPGLTATVTFPDGKKVKATSLGLARRLDFGMLRINEEDGDRFPYLDMGFSAELKQGQWVMAVGHPGGIDEKRGLVFRAGRIIANRIDKDVLQTDCTLVGGDSGGPLVDMNGKVVGIHSRIGSKLWDNLHAPIDVYSENWDRMDRGLVIDGAPHLGFKVRPSTNRVTSVETDGPAKKAGLKANDRIVEINGDKIESYEDLTFAIAKLRPYQKVSFKIKRRSKVIEMEVAVREKR